MPAVCLAAGDLNEVEDVEALQPGRFNREQVGGEHLGGVLTDELAPGGLAAPRSRRDAQELGHSHVRDLEAQLERLALDALVAPARVLFRELQDQRPPLGVAGRTLPRRACRKAAHLCRTKSRCQRSKVTGFGSRADQPDLGRSWLKAANRTRSPGCQAGLPTLRSRTRS